MLLEDNYRQLNVNYIPLNCIQIFLKYRDLDKVIYKTMSKSDKKIEIWMRFFS